MSLPWKRLEEARCITPAVSLVAFRDLGVVWSLLLYVELVPYYQRIVTCYFVCVGQMGVCHVCATCWGCSRVGADVVGDAQWPLVDVLIHCEKANFERRLFVFFVFLTWSPRL